MIKSGHHQRDSGTQTKIKMYIFLTLKLKAFIGNLGSTATQLLCRKQNFLGGGRRLMLDLPPRSCMEQASVGSTSRVELTPFMSELVSVAIFSPNVNPTTSVVWSLNSG
eukprot:GHVT01043348.1.p2 GENE.GHVT01043348.1~~GHVT01043348.1.p2  ORF type:complete len:109 (-),score=5.98 GHVT01043348.1:1604-1930(-)